MKQKKIEEILGKNKSDWNEIADNFSQTRHNLWFEFKDFEFFAKEGDKILDLGCGNGRLGELFKNKKVEYVGVDQSEKLIKIARDKFQTINFKHRFIVADALNLETKFSKDEFDVIFAIAFLHHLPSSELRLKLLKDCFSFLRVGGLAIFTVWNLWQPRLIWKYRLLKRDVLISFKTKDKTIARYYHIFTKGELSGLVKRAGFKIKECYYVKKGERSNWLKGYNLVLVAQK